MNRVFIDDCQHWLTSDFPRKDGYDMIYIDPPYDTRSSSFCYNDSRDSWDVWFQENLAIAKPLMKDDSAIFVSIDDNKVIETCLACDNVFGRKNRVAIMITHQSQRSNAKLVNITHEYVVVYAKNKDMLPKMEIPRRFGEHADIIKKMSESVSKVFSKNGIDEAQSFLTDCLMNDDIPSWMRNYRKVDSNGEIFFPQDLSVPGTPNEVNIPEIGIHLSPLPTRKWSSAKKIKQLYDDGRIEFLAGRPYEKHYLKDSKESISSILPYYSRNGTEELKRIGCAGLFDTPKPVAMIEKFILSLSNNKDSFTVLDFFAGSGTTAQAVYQANQKVLTTKFEYDLVQINEPLRKGTKPYNKAKELCIDTTVPSVLKYRIDRYLDKIKKEADYEWFLIV